MHSVPLYLQFYHILLVGIIIITRTGVSELRCPALTSLFECKRQKISLIFCKHNCIELSHGPESKMFMQDIIIIDIEERREQINPTSPLADHDPRWTAEPDDPRGQPAGRSGVENPKSAAMVLYISDNNKKRTKETS